jgi:hypothetical protein
LGWQCGSRREARRSLDPVVAVVEALKTHEIVALGEGAHGNEQAHAFRLSLIRDARFAAVGNDIVVECEDLPRVRIRDGKPDFSAPIPRNEWGTLRMEDQFDAVLYLGHPSTLTFSQPSRTLCADANYIRPRLARIALVGLPQVEADQLRQICCDQAGQ